MIVECSLSSQAKSEPKVPRKEALAGVVWISQEFLRVWRVSRIHSLIHTFILWGLGVSWAGKRGIH